MIKKISLILLLSSITMISYAANGFQQAFQSGSATGDTHLTAAILALHHFTPDNTFDHFSATPPATQFYQGDTQTHTDMATTAANTVRQTEIGNSIFNSAYNRPLYTHIDNDPNLQRAKIISNDAAHIVNGISDQYISCSKTQECHTDYTIKQCNESAREQHPTCTKNLIVQATPAQSIVQDVTVDLAGNAYRGIEFTIDFTTGKIIEHTGKLFHTNIIGNVKNMPCADLHITVSIPQDNHAKYNTLITVKTLPDCTHHFQGKFFVPQPSWLYIHTAIKFTVHFVGNIPPKITDEWNDHCETLEQRRRVGTCRLSQTTCSLGPATKIINGIPISRNCWEQQLTYQCGGMEPVENNCQPLLEQACSQIDSKCTMHENNECVRYQQTYRCPHQKCTGGIGVICNGETFCLQGDCTKHTREADQHFQQSASVLSAVAEASKQFDGHFIFGGFHQTCSDDFSGFNNCCRDTGWGHSTRLAHCSLSEKKLGHNKEAGLTIPIGRYCSHRILGICTAHKKSYCTFHSKLARIVQEQGRHQQLHIPWGSTENPHCRGLTAEELQKIDFSNIDFGEFYDDLNQKESMPDPNNTTLRIQQKIEQFSKTGNTHP